MVAQHTYGAEGGTRTPTDFPTTVKKYKYFAASLRKDNYVEMPQTAEYGLHTESRKSGKYH